MILAKSGFDGDVTIDCLKIVDPRLMDSIDLVECFDQSKAMAVRMDTAFLE